MTNLNTQPTTVLESLPQIIEQHISSALELLEILQQERQALISGRPESLEKVSVLKLKSVHTFKQLSEKLTKYLGGESIEQMLARIGSNMNLYQRWQELMTLATECQKHNLANGALLDERQSYVRNAIKSLFGHEAHPGVYGRWGDTSFRPENRLIGSA